MATRKRTTSQTAREKGPSLDRFGVARALREIAALLELEGGNPYRARAYERGAAALEALEDDLATLVDEERLTSVAGIGEALAKQIAELFTTGRSEMLDRLRAEFPPGVLELMRVPNLGVSKVRALHDALGIDSVDALEKACREGKVRAVRGFGEKTESRILAGIEAMRTREERVLLVEAMPIADGLLAWVRAQDATERADLAGELRRAQESTTSIEIVASTRDREALADAFETAPFIVEVLSRTQDRVVARLPSGLHAILHLISPPSAHALAMLLHTGPREHVAALQRLAGTRTLHGKTEEAIYASLGLHYVTPELREDPHAIERAAEGEIDLVTTSDVRGMVHCHTDWSDGRHELEAMARAADAMGLDYITITDHSAAAYYANGLDEERLKRQWDAIADVQERVKVKLLRGSECDILADGALDFPDRVLEQLDVIVASVHSGFKMDEETMTRRLVRAMRHPLFKIWGHALGRLVERRAPYAVRVEEVLDAVADSRVAIEINGDPYRLDLPPPWIRVARARNVPFVVSVDAHSTGALQNVRFGVAMARRGGLAAREVLNTRSTKDFMRAVRPA